MRVVFFLRSDADRHVGGAATGQIEGYVQFLRAAGADVTLWRGDRDPPGNYDIGHVMNLDWPVEVVRQTAAARRRCRRVVLSPVHHRDRWMDAFHRSGRAGFARRLAGRTSLERFEALRGGALAMRAPRQVPEAARQLAFGVRDRQRFVLDAVDLCLTLASGEEDSLVEDFGFDGPTRRVENSAQVAAEPLPAGLPEEFLLCVARVEARKNHLALLDAGQDLDVPLVLAGPANNRHRAVVRAVTERERASSAVLWLRDLPRPQVLSLFAAASCHVLASWCEVVAQVDLEAAAAGTRSVTTSRSHVREYLGDDTVYWDPDSGSAGLTSAVAAALEQPRPAPAPRRFGAAASGSKLLEAYQSVLEAPRPAAERRPARAPVAA